MSSRSPGTTNADDVCIFDWDGVALGKVRPRVPPQVRAARGQPTRPSPAGPGQLRFEIHCVGEVWSSALWALRTRYGIGAATFDRIVLSSQFMYTANERFGEAVNALVDGGSELDRRRQQGRDLHRDGDQARDLRERLPLSAPPAVAGTRPQKD